MLELIAAIVGGLTVLAGAWALTAASRRRVEAPFRRGGLPPDPPSAREGTLARPALTRLVAAPLLGLGQRFGRALPPSLLRSLTRRLMWAGEPITVHTLLTLQAVAVLPLVFMALALIAIDAETLTAAVTLGLGVLIAALPALWLDRAVQVRREAIVRAMPDSVDLIVAMVEAGLSIEAALWKVAHRTVGPLADELRTVVQETTLGRSRRDALAGLADRSPTPDLRGFVQALIHAQQTGSPLGPVLRTQATEIRRRERQRAQEQAQKAPIKVLVLMLFFVMPSLLLVLLGPAFMRLADVI
jgi:tight adherence protein C